MALSFSTCSSNLGLVTAKSKPLLPPQPHHVSLLSKPSWQSLFSCTRNPHHLPCAIEKPNESSENTLFEDKSENQPEEKEVVDTSTEVAAELKQMLQEKKEREQQGDSLFTGVSQEVKEIEWPDLRKVLGTTGVVLAVIAGSTAALLSVNGILAEISDQVFAGKGIQDFF